MACAAVHPSDLDIDTTISALVVDDEREIRDLYYLTLSRVGLRVETAASGEEALSILSAQPTCFDVIITDICMPGLDGIDLLRSVREIDAEIAVIVVTGAPNLGSATETVRHRAFRYLTKPVPLKELIECTKEAGAAHRTAQLKQAAFEICGAEARSLIDRRCLGERLDYALEHAYPVFQPIVDAAVGRVFGYEALLRSKALGFEGPRGIIDAAEELDRVHELGRIIRAAVAERAVHCPEDALLFVNVHALELDDPQLYEPDAPLSQHACRTVLEITERMSLEGVSELSSRLERLRALGFRIAIDDLGSGYSSLSSLGSLRPDVVKLDRSLIRGIEHSEHARHLVRTLLSLCHSQLAVQVVVEGIENEAEMAIVRELGGTLLQGFLLGRPCAEFLPITH